MSPLEPLRPAAQPPSPADNIRAEMARQRRTQQDVALLLGVSQTAVSRRLTGSIPFDVSELLTVARWLGVSAASLLGERAAA